MARGFDVDRERKAALSALGRGLARRCRSTCELCETSGVRLDPWEVPPEPADAPDLDHALMLCERCREAADGGKLGSADAWRFLEGVAWSELPPIQVTAVRLLDRLAAEGAGWATDTREGLYLDPVVEAWLAA